MEVVIVGLIGAVCANIHGSRGHSAVGGFMRDLDLGLIGLIAVLCIPKSQEQLERRATGWRKGQKVPCVPGSGPAGSCEMPSLRQQLGARKSGADRTHCLTYRVAGGERTVRMGAPKKKKRVAHDRYPETQSAMWRAGVSPRGFCIRQGPWGYNGRA